MPTNSNMNQHLIGTRIGAILSADPESKTTKFLGYGTFQGYESYTSILPNPKFLLDSGEIVYGSECWWGNEESIKERIKKYESFGWTIETVTRADMVPFLSKTD